jgi:hypothetical protein
MRCSCTAVAVDEADGDRLDTRGHELLTSCHDAGFVQWFDDAPVRGDALDDL